MLLKKLKININNSERSFDLPTKKDEEWKYTDLSFLEKSPLELIGPPESFDIKKLQGFVNEEDLNIIFINGALFQEYCSLSSLPKGLSLSNLNKKAEGSTANDLKHFLALNKEISKDGTLLKVASNTAVNKLIHIIHVTDTNENHVFSSNHCYIEIGEACDVSILESHISFSKTNYLVNNLTDIKLNENSNLNFCKAQNDGQKGVHIGSTRIWQQKNSNLKFFSLATGSQLTRNNVSIILEGNGAHSSVDGLYALEETQHIDNHTMIEHKSPKCSSDQKYKGIIKDNAHGVFNGKIYVHKEAQKTDAHQINRNLLVGKHSRIDTKPQLEIFADDVKCTHGATVGQLNQDEIFYLQSRGIEKDTAIKILSHAFADDILNSIKHAGIRKKCNYLLSKSGIFN